MVVYKGLTYSDDYKVCYGFNKETYKKDEKVLRFHPNTKIICPSAFADCTHLEEIIFPGKLERIDDYAFVDCKNIKKMKFGKNIFAVGDKAFYGTYCHFEKLYLPKISYMGLYSFASFEIEKLILPHNLKKFEPTAFCKVKEYVIEDSRHYKTINGDLYTFIAYYNMPQEMALARKGFNDAPIEQKCTMIERSAFENFKNENYELHLENIKYIKEDAFEEASLGKVYVKTISSMLTRNTFINCNIKKLFLYKDSTFCPMEKLTIEDIELEKGCTKFYIKDGVLYKGNILLYYLNSNKREKFVCPENVETIYSFAFPENVFLKEIVLNNNNIMLYENSISRLLNLEKFIAPSKFNSMGEIFHEAAPIKEIFIPDKSRLSGCSFLNRKNELTIHMTKEQMEFLEYCVKGFTANEFVKIEYFKTFDELYNEGKTISEINKILKKQNDLLNL